MARRTTAPPPERPAERPEERIVDIDVGEEMRGSFLEYAYSVIYARALPDARDGLKPVQRRILFQMAQMGLRPDRAHVKSARVVGDVMGRLHPHGDGAIYDALVRMAQWFSMRAPMVDGHGNFGSLGNDDPPAAMRYTECRLSQPAMLMTATLDEDVVDFIPNYDGQELQPEVLPAALPNLLVNGTAGIAVGMATNMPPHNLVEVVAAARHLVKHPNASLDALMRFVPGPDLPTGGKIVGLDGIREAYETGRGSFRTRATARIESLTPRRKGIVITELPYNVGPERVVEKISELVKSKKVQGISDLTDLTDGKNGLRLVIEVKNGFHPEAILDELYRLTSLEESFAINNVALVDGQPRTLGLKDLLTVYIDHRLEVVRRRSAYRRRRAEERLHLVEGMLVAIVDIDEVIQIIRSSDDTAMARDRLMRVFDLTQTQTDYILEMPLRRLTKFSRLELEKEQEDLQNSITGLSQILEDDAKLRKVVSDELAGVAAAHGTPRRTILLESSATTATSAAAVPLEVADEPCRVLLSSTGLLARTQTLREPAARGQRPKHDVIVSSVTTTARGSIGVVTSAGRVLRLAALDLPGLPDTADAPNLAGGAPVSEFVSLGSDERVLALTGLAAESAGLALGTAGGVVKRVLPDYPLNRDEFEVVALKQGDRVVGAVELAHDDAELVFVTSDAQLLRFGASSVRQQGRSAAGMAGIRLAAGMRAVFFGAVDDPTGEVHVLTVSGPSAALPGTVPGSAKITPYAEYPAKGRGTGGVRCHRFLKGE
ncbi:MAG: DNA topoisomerase IV subunit A, partial [Candidatus Nanopelagicales bacterium]